MTQPDLDIDELLRTLQSPYGSEQHVRARQNAARALLQLADKSYPRIIELLTTGAAANDLVLIELLPAFGRDDSVPLLSGILLSGRERAARIAGGALARHQSSLAEHALEAGLQSEIPEAIIASADGLLDRGDAQACRALISRASIDDATVRYHVLLAATRLGCLNAPALQRMLDSELDADIRELLQAAIDGMESPRE